MLGNITLPRELAMHTFTYTHMRIHTESNTRHIWAAFNTADILMQRSSREGTRISSAHASR